jgi:hypothetical protein
MRYRILVDVSELYEVFITANSLEEAEKKAVELEEDFDNYTLIDGSFTLTTIDVEEDEEKS